MGHTYIFKEAKWKAKGKYYDRQLNVTNVVGETVIEHLEEHWILDGFLEVKVDQPIRFFNKYKIEPLQEGRD